MNNDMLEVKKNQYKEKIDKIAKESFNNEQKIVAKSIIENSKAENIDAIYQLISQRVKTGFVFDSAPEVNHNCISLVVENNEMLISPDSSLLLNFEHKLIIGENFDALKNLLVAYTNPNNGQGLIDMIYIDPPYNTESAKEDGNDYKEEVEAKKFVYRDKFTRDGWLNMMNERLKLALKLLSNRGVIFISIDDKEQAYLKVLCDEIFGEVNFIGTFKWNRTAKAPSLSNSIRIKYEYILCYKKRDSIILRGKSSYNSQAPLLHLPNKQAEILFPKNSFIFKDDKSLNPGNYSDKYKVELLDTIHIENGTNTNDFRLKGCFAWAQPKIDEYISKGFKFEVKKSLSTIYYSLDNEGKFIAPSDLISDEECGVKRNTEANEELEKIEINFPYSKPVSLIKYLINMACHDKKDAVILDFFAGSGTTGQAVMELNEEDSGKRKCILVTNNENNIAKEITWERLYRVINSKGSKGEKIEWRYSKTLPSLINNRVRVFELREYELKINDLEEAKKLVPFAEKQFKALNEDFKFKGKFDIYNELSSLNPYKKV